MSNEIKGITVKIGGDTKDLDSDLKKVNKETGSLQSELRQVNSQLKFNPSNTVLLTQKQTLLKQEISQLKDKESELKEAVKQVHDQFDRGNISADKVRAVEREYEKVKSQVKGCKSELTSAGVAAGNFGAKIKNSASKIKSSMKSAFSMSNVTASLGAVATATGAFLKGSLDKAVSAEQVNANLAQTLKSTKGAAGMTAQSLDKLTSSLSKSTAYSGSQIKQGEAMMLTFTGISKKTFPDATKAMLDYATKMKVEPEAAAMTLGKALNDPVKGITKLTKSGVTFTEQQQKQIKAMAKAGDTAGAQRIMIAELNKEFGGQAAAQASTYAGKQQQLTNQMNAMKVTIGQAIMPVLTQLMAKVVPIISKVSEFISKNPKLVTAILAAFTAIGLIVGGISLINKVTAAFGIISKIALGPIPLIIAAIAIAVGALVVVIVKHWSQIKSWAAKVKLKIKSFFAAIGTWLKTHLKQILAVMFVILTGGAALWPILIAKNWDKIKAIFQNILQKARDLKSKALNWGKDLIQNIVNGIKSKISAVGDAVKGVANKIKSFLHFSVPDEGPLVDFESWMPDFMGGIANSIEKSIPKVSESVKRAASAISGINPSISLNSTSKINYDSKNPKSGMSIIVNQKFDGKVPSPAETARQTRDGIREIVRRQNA